MDCVNLKRVRALLTIFRGASVGNVEPPNEKEMPIPKRYKTSYYHFHLRGNIPMHAYTPLPSIIVVDYSTDISFLRLLLEYHNDSLMLFFVINKKVVFIPLHWINYVSKIATILQNYKFYYVFLPIFRVTGINVIENLGILISHFIYDICSMQQLSVNQKSFILSQIW